MSIKRMDNVAIVVSDLDQALDFFLQLGLELDGRAEVSGPWVDKTVGLSGVHSEIAVLRTPDGHSKIELSKYHSPAEVAAEPPAQNAVGTHRLMFSVDDIDRTLANISAEPLGEVANYEDSFRLCYLRGPSGIIVALAEELKS